MQHRDLPSLDRGWRLWSSDFTAEEPTAVAVPAPGGADLVDDLALPLDVRTVLVRARGLPDPRIDRQSLATDWVATREWWLGTRLELPALGAGERAFLRTRGVDDFGQVFVDGRHRGTTGSFNRTAFIALDGLAAGGHDLALRLWPCHPAAIESREPLKIRRREQDFKCVLFVGGDHNPFLYNAGIAVAPQLLVARGALLRGAHLAYAFTAGDAVEGTVRVDLDAWQAVTIQATLEPDGFAGETLRFAWDVAPGDGTRALPFSAAAVARWFPAGLGPSHCYRLTVTIAGTAQQLTGLAGFRSVARRDNGAFVQRAVPSVFAWHAYENNGPFGQEYYKGYDAIREAGEAWPERPREGDYRHQHAVNGADLFIIGGSVVPPTLFWSDWSAERQCDLVRRARGAGLNTLRIWGGGLLYDDAFFAEADRLGIIVQHDFLNFATFTDRSLAHQRAREGEYRLLVRALASHPSVMTYNGGNELYQIRNRPEDPPFHAMARVVREESPQQLFHRSCPVNPEVHGPWQFDLDHAARYASQAAIFNSECGVMAVPSLKTLRRALSPAAIAAPLGAEWRHRVNDPGYFRTLENNLRLFAPLASHDVAAVVRCTQWIQALGYQVIVEEHRRQAPATTGLTTWEYNEPWRDLNWGVVDSDLVPKHSYSAFRRAAAPRLVSARTPTFVYAPGATLRAEVHLSGPAFAATVTATLHDAHGVELARAELRGASGAAGSVCSACIGTFAAVLPASGIAHLRLLAICADGAELRNEQVFCVLPRGAMAPLRALYISGGCYEDGISLEFLRAAGFQLEVVHASPDRPLPAVAFAGRPLVIIGPVFNPITSLGAAAIADLAAAVAAGTGLLWLVYNTSAYVSGRYAVDDLAGSPLEALLPVTFPADHYRNSEDPVAGGPLTAVGSHAVWDGVDLSYAPDPGLGVRIVPRSSATVLARRADEAVLVSGNHGAGRVVVSTIAYGGHNYQGVGVRGWNHAHRLLANLAEFAARGTVTPGAPSPHAFAPLLALSRAQLAVAATPTAPGAWIVAVRNAGTATAFAVQFGNDHADEGNTFDWHAADDFITLLPGEERVVGVHAVAREGHQLPAGLRPVVAAWPEAIG